MGDSTYNNQNTIYNQMVPENIYGLQGKNCRANGTCLPNTYQAMQSDPSLHEVASFNNHQLSTPLNNPQFPNSLENPNNEKPSLMQATQAYDLGGSTSGDVNPQATGNLQQLPEIEQIEKYDVMPDTLIQTPATTMSSTPTFTDSINATFGLPTGGSMAVTPESLQFHNGFLRSQIGRRVSVDFHMGSGTIIQKSGYLLGVGQDYILINELDTNDITSCDYYNIKFIRFYY